MEYQSPGGAFTNAMDDFLMRQHMMARQAQQDALTQQREDRITAQQQEEMSMRREEQQARREDLIQRHNERKTADIEKRMSNMVPGDIPDAEMLKHADELGIGGTAFPKPAASLPGVAAVPVGREQVGLTPLAEAPRPFAGSAKQRQDVTDEKRQEDYINTLPEGPVRTAALYELKTKKTMPAVAAKSEPHSQSFTEYTDYKNEELKAGRTPLSFNDYATMDANRKKPTTPGGNGADITAATVGAMGPAGFDMLAKNVAKTGNYPAFGMMAKGEKIALISALTKRAAQYDVAKDAFTAEGEQNPNVPDLAGNKADLAANSAALTQLQKNVSAVTAFANTAKANGDLFKGILKDVPDIGVTWLNKPLRSAATAMGSESMSKFNVLRQSVQTEYARTINNPNLTGVLSDTARMEIEKGLSDNATVAQFKAALDMFDKEAANREKMLQQELGAVRKSIKGGPAAAPKSKYKVSVE